jgi:hypothetical protein
MFGSTRALDRYFEIQMRDSGSQENILKKDLHVGFSYRVFFSHEGWLVKANRRSMFVPPTPWRP